MDNLYNWIFFAANAKPTSMRRAVAERFAETEPVIIVDHPLSLARDRKAPSLKARCEHLPGVEGCWQYRPLHYPERLPIVGKIGRLLNRRILQRELNCLLPPEAKRIVCYDSPTQDCLVGKLGEDLSVYLAIDDRTITVEGIPIPGEMEAEKRLLGKVDKVICVSEILAHVLSSRIPDGRVLSIHVLPNGYDERIFDPDREYPEPSILKKVTRPRILIAGHVSARMDWEGMGRVAKARPNWTWIFLGPAELGMKERISELLGEKGIYRPAIPIKEVPAWIAHSDACAVPYRLNAFTIPSCPLKAIEYLAMGAPVLSTRVPALIRYGHAIKWVEEGNSENYAKVLDELLFIARSPNEVRRRREAVAGDSWASRLEQIQKIVLQ
jgi:glycosyltransferase involved in cell wall biosynthesis